MQQVLDQPGLLTFMLIGLKNKSNNNESDLYSAFQTLRDTQVCIELFSSYYFSTTCVEDCWGWILWEFVSILIIVLIKPNISANNSREKNKLNKIKKLYSK